MLVLQRRIEESIVIGDNIVITVVEVRGDKVRFGITAPREVPVHRQEVYDAIEREKMKDIEGEVANILSVFDFRTDGIEVSERNIKFMIHRGLSVEVWRDGSGLARIEVDGVGTTTDIGAWNDKPYEEIKMYQKMNRTMWRDVRGVLTALNKLVRESTAGQTLGVVSEEATND